MTSPRISLTKGAPAAALAQQGVLRVNLNWAARPAAYGQPAVDLDLACLYELGDGTKGCVQALGNAFTAYANPQASPLIWLDADDRSGNVAGGENMMIDMTQAQRLRRVLVFAFIYEGAPNWQAASAVATLIPSSGPQVEIRLDEPDPHAAMCAIALVYNNQGQLAVQREVRYIRGGHAELDQAYGWGMQWTTGRK